MALSQSAVTGFSVIAVNGGTPNGDRAMVACPLGQAALKV